MLPIIGMCIYWRQASYDIIQEDVNLMSDSPIEASRFLAHRAMRMAGSPLAYSECRSPEADRHCGGLAALLRNAGATDLQSLPAGRLSGPG